MFLGFVENSRAIYGIVIYDMVCGFLIITLLKTLGACLTLKQYQNINMYKDLRYVQSIVIALATVGFICFFGVRVLSLKKELRGPFAAHYLPYCFVLCFFTVFEFHVSKVVASAAWHYKQTKEIPESF
jgi:hypothetical protein